MISITKKDKSIQEFDPTKIVKRLKDQSYGLKVDYHEVAINTQKRLPSNTTSYEIDQIAADNAYSLSTTHWDYNILGARLLMTALHKEVEHDLGKYLDINSDVLHEDLKPKYLKWKKEIDELIAINKINDFLFDYLGIKSLMNTYLLSKEINRNKVITELPHQMYFRVALFLADTFDDFSKIFVALSSHKVSVATPVLTNAGTKNNSMISCSLNTLKDDSLEGIEDTLKNVSIMSSYGAGIGLYVGNLRSKESSYRNGKGKAGGHTKFAKMLDSKIRFFAQSESRRGAVALYQDIWHKDILDHLQLRKQISEEMTARDVFPAINIPDLFYKRLIDSMENNKPVNFSLFCPHESLKYISKPLYETWGEEFEKLYTELELSDCNRTNIDVKELMLNVVTAQTETGTPYIFNRDTVNRSNMQSNLGTIKSSNLCIEFISYSDDKNSSQCALALIPVMNYVKNGKFDFKDFAENTQLANFILNRIIDNNKWTTKESEFAGKNQRTVGLGIAGLADLALKLDLAYTSDEFKVLNKEISKLLYYSSILGSCAYAKQYNISTNALRDCDLSKSVLHNKKMNIDNNNSLIDILTIELGIGFSKPANTLLIAYMPSASTSKLLGCNESFEPIQDLFFTRKGSEGEFTMANKYLLQDLEKRNLWNQNLANEIMIKGSLKDIDFVELGLTVEDSNHLKQKYQTVWEIGMKTYIEMCADRQVYTDQSMSMNTYYSEAKASKIISGIIHAWKLKMKTGVYYTKVKKQTKPNSNLSFVQEVKTSNNKGIDCFGCSA